MTAVIQQNFPIQAYERGVRTERLGLYLHLPYCRTKCTYCAFVSAPPRSEREMDEYANALIEHLKLGAMEAQDREVSTVFFGGGTPSLTGPDRLEKIFETIHAHYRIKSDAEITLEANPESATVELFKRLQPLGLNRISIGAQSFHDDELAQIGRVHGSSHIRRAVENAHAGGIKNVSLDLIYGLPGQSPDRWQASVEQAIACGVEHLSAYGLTYEEGTLLHRQYTSGGITPAEDDTYVLMYQSLQQIADQAGFTQYEISNWSKPGRQCRHNLVYWDRDEYLAFGVSACGFFKGVRFGVIADTRRYMDFFLRKNPENFWHEDILKEKETIGSRETASDAMIFGLRKCEGIDLAGFETRFGYSPLARWECEIQLWQERGLLETADYRLRLARNAYLVSNEVMQAFLE